MKYIPLNNSPNISRSRFKSLSPTLVNDVRGFPHVTWMESKLNEYEINYAFWDGLKWAYKGKPAVYISQEELIYSQNSMVLSENDLPYIVFARKNATYATLSLATYSNKWNFNELDVNYNVGWIGVTRYDRNIDLDFSSSSSSSSSSSNSSSSSSLLSPSSSSSGISSSSSTSLSSLSSSSVSSNSSSSSINSSSSSSSYNDSNYFVVVYDMTNYMFKVYAITGAGWVLWGRITIPLMVGMLAYVSVPHNIKIDICGRRLGISYIENSTSILYNFLDLDNRTWVKNTFYILSESSSYGAIIDFDVSGYYIEDRSYLSVAWISRTDSAFNVCSKICNDLGVEISSGLSTVVESNVVDILTSFNNVVNGYRKITVQVDDTLLHILVAGASSKVFDLDALRVWETTILGIEGMANGVVPLYVDSDYSNGVNIALISDSNDVYYFEPSLLPAFDIADSKMMILNNKEVYDTVYANGRLYGDNVTGVAENICGAILKDNRKSVFITPDIFSSTSSSSSEGYSSDSSLSSDSSSSSDPGIIFATWSSTNNMSRLGSINGKTLAYVNVTPTPPANVSAFSDQLLMDGFGNLWAVGSWMNGNDVVYKFKASTGHTTYDTYSVGNPSGFANAWGLAIDLDNNIWTANTQQCYLTKLDASNNYYRTNPTFLNNPLHIAFDKNNDMWTTHHTGTGAGGIAKNGGLVVDTSTYPTCPLKKGCFDRIFVGGNGDEIWVNQQIYLGLNPCTTGTYTPFSRFDLDGNWIETVCIEYASYAGYMAMDFNQRVWAGSLGFPASTPVASKVTCIRGGSGSYPTGKNENSVSAIAFDYENNMYITHRGACCVNRLRNYDYNIIDPDITVTDTAGYNPSSNGICCAPLWAYWG